MFGPEHFGIDFGQDDEAKKQARSKLQARIQIGGEVQARLIEHCARNIPRDRYVPPALMRFKRGEKGNLVIQYARGSYTDPWAKYETIGIHKNALRQLSETAGIDGRYVSKLNLSDEPWRIELLAHNLNELFHKQQFKNRLKERAEFLHRLVGDELRGFLTQSYNRHLLSLPLLRAFIDVCAEVGASPVRALVGDTKIGLQCYLPYVFEILRKDFVAFGVWFGNSDFGDGRLKISHTFMRLRGFGSAVIEDSYNRVHLGGVVRTSDLKLSDEVAKKEIDTVASAIQDVVRQILRPEAVERICEVLAKAAEEEIPWEKLKGNLGKFLNKKELADVEKMLELQIEDLPPPGVDKDGNPLATRWWAAAAVAHLSESKVDVDRAIELKQEVSRLLGLDK